MQEKFELIINHNFGQKYHKTDTVYKGQANITVDK
jgi:hypothetical protein